MTYGDFLAAIPWPQFLFAAMIGFILGALAGYEYRKLMERRTSRGDC